jgi:hypothetical protein
MFLQNAGRLGHVPQKKFLYDRRGPWPQPSPTEPLGTSPEVLHLPAPEVRDFQWNIGLRYFRDLICYSPVSLARALGFDALPEIPDGQLADVLTRGLYSRFLAPLDEIDRATFAGDPNPQDATLDYKYDFTPISSVDPYGGMYVAQTITHLRRKHIDSKEFEVRAIAVGEQKLVLRPSDGAAWELAKYYVLQGCSYGTLFTQHPNVHFPYDTINAVTKGSIPTDHLMFQLLYPHLRFSLVLDNAVLQSKASVISNFRHTIYDPFTAAASDGLMSFFVAGYKGIPGNSSYPGYSYPKNTSELPLPPTEYGRFLREYFEPFHWLTTKVVEHMSDEEMSYAEEWSRWIRVWIESFPELPYRKLESESERKATRDKLAFALAVMLWDLTVVHSTDHHDFATDVPVEWKCFRLRVPAPAGKSIPPVDRTKLSKKIDIFKSYLAHRMFFAPTTVTRLIEIEYDFQTNALRRIHNDFVERLRAVDAGLEHKGIRRFMSLSEFAASIQY